MKKYWKSIEEKDQQTAPPEGEDIEITQNSLIGLGIDDKTTNSTANRRDFLKLCGFSLTAATLAASCESRINKAIPFITKPEEGTSGVAK